MTNEHTDRVDQAAVLGVALAASVSISAADGPWEPMESVVGLILICLLGTYFGTHRVHGDANRRKRVSLASVLALSWCLVMAWPIQLVLSAVDGREWTDVVLVVIWVALMVSHARRMRVPRPDRTPLAPTRWLIKLVHRL